MKSLFSQTSKLADPSYQIRVINDHTGKIRSMAKFEEKLHTAGLFPLKPTGIETFQINLGYLCNMTCKHCHVDAGPDRREVMSRETLRLCLQALETSAIQTVDLTGGAPEMNPHFRWFVDELFRLGKHVIVRSNLTILDTPKFQDLPGFMAERKAEITCSLPYYNKKRTDSQRGEGTYDKSVKVLKMLNTLGYGREETGLRLNLVYNPVGAFLPPAQPSLEDQFKKALMKDHGIGFNSLYTITNLPISRFLNFLLESGNLDEYMENLITAFNPAAARGVMCRNTISIGWDGKLYDCDFNQMLDIKTSQGAPGHIRDWSEKKLNGREIQVNQHCFGCTAGAGSSCGGATTGL
ncbi:MAG: arsenosugar biosynthesis radical SAM (seleno)protein ArsS [Balneolales bacterium]